MPGPKTQEILQDMTAGVKWDSQTEAGAIQLNKVYIRQCNEVVRLSPSARVTLALIYLCCERKTDRVRLTEFVCGPRGVLTDQVCTLGPHHHDRLPQKALDVAARAYRAVPELFWVPEV